MDKSELDWPFEVYREEARRVEELEELISVAREKLRLRQLADALERDEVPSRDELTVLTSLCRAKAEAIRPVVKRRRPPKLFDPELACFMAHRLRVVYGRTYESAIAEVARLHDLKDDRRLKREYGERLPFISGFFPAINSLEVKP